MKAIPSTVAEQAKSFLKKERQFRLGYLPTEQAHPRTADFSRIIRKDAQRGVRLLLSVDRDIARTAPRILSAPLFRKLVTDLRQAIITRKRIYFSGCGATGRLSILLEACWRRWAREFRSTPAGRDRRWARLENQVCSIMTGGDYALIRSVEFFEDYSEFGRRQVREMRPGPGDVLVAVSEGGETSSVIGTVHQALECGAKAYYVFNNPAKHLSAHLRRCRGVLEHPDVSILELVSGPMAIAGSTRMQATTFELLILGAALETALREMLAASLTPRQLHAARIIPQSPRQYGTVFARLLKELSSAETSQTIANLVELETRLYSQGGYVTYFGGDYLLDIFTDTTERSPTFMLPPFKRHDDLRAPEPWAFVKNPLWPTRKTWQALLGRPPRCLDWNGAQYRWMGAPADIAAHPPHLSMKELMKFRIGNEDNSARYANKANAAILVVADDEVAPPAGGNRLVRAFRRSAAPFAQKALIIVGGTKRKPAFLKKAYHIRCTLPSSPLRLWHHLAIKLMMNTLSTGTMGRLGRVEGNWMTHVHPTNKKLIDRGTRLIAELTGLRYDQACLALFTAIDAVKKLPADRQSIMSPVVYALKTIAQSTSI